MSHAHITPDDPRLTAYVLGELEPSEAATMEAALAASPELRRTVDGLRATTADLFAALQAEPVPPRSIDLTGARTTVVSTSATAPQRRNCFMLVNAVTLLLLIGVVISLQGGPERSPSDVKFRGLAKLSLEEEAQIEEAIASVQSSLGHKLDESAQRLLREEYLARSAGTIELESEAEVIRDLFSRPNRGTNPQQPVSGPESLSTEELRAVRLRLLTEIDANGNGNGTVDDGAIPLSITMDAKLAAQVETYNELVKQRRFGEAKEVAREVRAAAPKNPIATQLFYQSRIAGRGNEPTAEHSVDFLNTLSDAERSAVANSPGAADNSPYPADWSEVIRLRATDKAGASQRGGQPGSSGGSREFGLDVRGVQDSEYSRPQGGDPHVAKTEGVLPQSVRLSGRQPAAGQLSGGADVSGHFSFSSGLVTTNPQQQGQSQSALSVAAQPQGADGIDLFGVFLDSGAEQKFLAQDGASVAVGRSKEAQMGAGGWRFQPFYPYQHSNGTPNFGWAQVPMTKDNGHWSINQQRGKRLVRDLSRTSEMLAEMSEYGDLQQYEMAYRLGTEAYAPVVENNFTIPQGEEALSTFSLDVDTASYSNVRRFITQQQLPPPDAVRLEELVNYFDYDLPQPEGDDPFSVTLDATSCPWNPQHRVVRIGLQGRELELDKRPLTRLVFLLDISGSMSNANKLPLVKESMKLLVDQLGENDRIAIVTYSGEAALKLDSTSGSDKEAILAAIDSLSAGGSTNGAGGIQLAYETAAKHFLQEASNRVILCTDGDFNVGVSSDDELVRMIEEKRESGVFLSIFGYGMGNLKDAKLEGLADKGNGHYGYIDDLDEARKVFIEELTGLLYTIAKDVKLQVEFNPAKVAAYRLLGYENRTLAAQDFNNDKVDAGEMGAGHTVTALYEIVPKGPWSPPVENATPAVDALKYQESGVVNGVSTDSANADRRTNVELAAAIAEQLQAAGLGGYDINVTVANGMARITGNVVNDEQRTKIDEIAAKFQQLTFSNLVVVAGSRTLAGASTLNSQPSALNSPELLTVKLRYKQPDGDESVKREFPLADEPRKCSQDLQFAAAVTGFGMLLRNSQHGAGVNWDLVIELAEGAKGDDESGRRDEFIDLARQARRLWNAAYPHGSPAEWRQRLTSLVSPSPAPVTIEAAVSKVSGKYAKISIGTSSGIADGQVVYVVRTIPDDQQPGRTRSMYVGELRIIDVQPDASVGEFEPAKSDAALAIGDRVLTEL